MTTEVFSSGKRLADARVVLVLCDTCFRPMWPDDKGTKYEDVPMTCGVCEGTGLRGWI